MIILGLLFFQIFRANYSPPYDKYIGTTQLLCPGSEHGEHHSELVFWKQSVNASLKLSL